MNVCVCFGHDQEGLDCVCCLLSRRSLVWVCAIWGVRVCGYPCLCFACECVYACLRCGGGEEGFHYWPAVTGILAVGLCCFGCEYVSVCESVLNTLCCFGCEYVSVCESVLHKLCCFVCEYVSVCDSVINTLCCFVCEYVSVCDSQI